MWIPTWTKSIHYVFAHSNAKVVDVQIFLINIFQAILLYLLAENIKVGLQLAPGWALKKSFKYQYDKFSVDHSQSLALPYKEKVFAHWIFVIFNCHFAYEDFSLIGDQVLCNCLLHKCLKTKCESLFDFRALNCILSVSILFNFHVFLSWCVLLHEAVLQILQLLNRCSPC